MLRQIRKWLAVRSYARRLGRQLRKQYGRRSYYTPSEVRSTVQTYGYDPYFSCYAMSMYCERSAFDDYHRFVGEHCSYDDMRGEVADRFFGGDQSFDATDLAPESSSSSDDAGGGGWGWGDWGGGESSCSDGGDSGGDGGGSD